MLVKGMRRLIVAFSFGLLHGTITAFTVAHSVTLAAATLGWVNVASAPVEAVIALSIVFDRGGDRARQGRSRGPGGPLGNQTWNPSRCSLRRVSAPW